MCACLTMYDYASQLIRPSLAFTDLEQYVRVSCSMRSAVFDRAAVLDRACIYLAVIRG